MFRGRWHLFSRSVYYWSIWRGQLLSFACPPCSLCANCQSICLAILCLSHKSYKHALQIAYMSHAYGNKIVEINHIVNGYKYANACDCSKWQWAMANILTIYAIWADLQFQRLILSFSQGFLLLLLLLPLPKYNLAWTKDENWCGRPIMEKSMRIILYRLCVHWLHHQPPHN